MRFCYLIFMSSLSDANSRKSMETQKQMFLLVSGGHICAPQSNTHIAFPYKAF